MKLSQGDKFPNFTITTNARENVALYDVLDRKTIFWVIRYIGCTVCRYDVHLLTQKYGEIAEKGYNLFVVMQSDVEHIRRDLAEVELPFEIICDDKQEIYKTLEVRPAESREELVGDQLEKLQAKGAAARAEGFVHGDYEGNELQLPALFVVSEEGEVLCSHYGRTIVDMPTVDELIASL